MQRISIILTVDVPHHRSGFFNTALILYLDDRYGLDATQAGLVYFAVAIPAGAFSPLSVSGFQQFRLLRFDLRYLHRVGSRINGDRDRCLSLAASALYPFCAS